MVLGRPLLEVAWDKGISSFIPLGGLNLKSFVMTNGFDEFPVVELHALDVDWTKWAYILRDESLWYLRILIEGQESTGSPWYSLKTFFSDVRYKKLLCDFVVRATSPVYDMNIENRYDWYQDMTISEMLDRMQTRYPMIKILSEPTAGRYSFLQSGRTDAQFLKYVLLPRMMASSGRVDYRFRVLPSEQPGGKSTLDIQPIPNSPTLQRVYVASEEKETYYVRNLEDSRSMAFSLRVEQARLLSYRRGALGVSYYTFDPRLKLFYDMRATESQVPSGGNLVEPKLLASPPVASISFSRDDVMAETQRFAQRKLERWWQQPFTATVEVEPNLDLVPGNVVDLSILLPTGQADASSIRPPEGNYPQGRWLVDQVSQIVLPSKVHTRLRLIRRGYYTEQGKA